MNSFTDIVRMKFLAAVDEYKMLDGADIIVVGFSGGADSVCLLHLLNSEKAAFGYQVKAVHVNHCIRGDEAKRDEEFAEKFCSVLRIPFDLVTVDCVNEAKKAKESLEECGRRVRYTAFNNRCTECSKIATAHNANDNAETVIFNLTRGTSCKGLSGIPYVRENIVRPILDCTRDEIEGYCEENGLEYVTDSTNLSDEYTRNKIRHMVLPVLKELNPNYLEAFNALCENVSDINSFIHKQALDLLDKSLTNDFTYKRNLLLDTDKAVVTEMLILAFDKFCGRTLDRSKIKALYRLLVVGGRMQIYGDVFAESKKDVFRFYTICNNTKSDVVEIENIPFECEYNNFFVDISRFQNNLKKVNHLTRSDMIDCEKTVGKLLLRTRMPGDKITLQKRNVTKSLKKLFNEMDLPVEKRDLIPVISDDVGVVWVHGFGTTKRCAVSQESDNIIIVRGKYNDRESNA